MIGSYYEVEERITERLKATLPAGVKVFTLADIAQIIESGSGVKQVTPAVHVMPGPDDVGSLHQSTGRQQVKQRWIVAIVVRSSHRAGRGTGQREQAGPIIDAVLKALNGWQPKQVTDRWRDALVRINGPQPLFDSGLLSIPLVFETKIITQGAADQ